MDDKEIKWQTPTSLKNSYNVYYQMVQQMGEH